MLIFIFIMGAGFVAAYGIATLFSIIIGAIGAHRAMRKK